MIEFTPVQTDTAAAHRRHSLDRFLSWPTFATVFGMAACMFAAGLFALPSRYKGASVLMLCGALLGGILFPLAAIRLRVPALAKRIHRQRANANANHTLTVSWSEAGFAASTPTANSMTPWPHYFRWREDDRVILLYLTEVLFQFIPKRVLSADQLASLRAAAAAGGVPGAPRGSGATTTRR